MAKHAQLKVTAGLPVYFCDPQIPWRHGRDENTYRLLRQYFPKDTDLARHSPTDLAANSQRSSVEASKRVLLLAR